MDWAAPHKTECTLPNNTISFLLALLSSPLFIHFSPIFVYFPTLQLPKDTCVGISIFYSLLFPNAAAT